VLLDKDVLNRPVLFEPLDLTRDVLERRGVVGLMVATLDPEPPSGVPSQLVQFSWRSRCREPGWDLHIELFGHWQVWFFDATQGFNAGSEQSWVPFKGVREPIDLDIETRQPARGWVFKDLPHLGGVEV
jgi:hypothetical protein